MEQMMGMKEQLNDLFSDFRKYIAPTYYHDRCERSLHMHLYVMHKRDILLTLSALVSGFLLLLFIGLAGPNATKSDSIRASEIFLKDEINGTDASRIISHGPFVLTTPQLSTYSYEMCVWLTFYLKKEEESEAFHKNFIIKSEIEGLASEAQARGVTLLNETDSKVGKMHQLYCAGEACEPIQVIHVEFLEFSHYKIGLTFEQLESVHEKYVISDIEFAFQTMNTSFTTLCIWFRFFFLVSAFGLGIWFTHSLHRFPFNDWSLEQKWTTCLFVLLILYDNPLYPMVFLISSQKPRNIEILFSSTFYSAILLFWLCFYHGIRQNLRSWAKFYAPKLIICSIIWLGNFYTMSWSSSLKMREPTAIEGDQFDDSILLNSLSSFYFMAIVSYFVYLAILVLGAFTELRAMPYFDLRLKLQTFLMIFVLLVAVMVCILSSSANPNDVDITLLRTLPFAYETSSSASFLALFAISNLYVTICAYFYHPSSSSLMDSRIVRDNPTKSMINDSDEDVIYGSDTEQTPKLVDTKTDEDSD